MKPENNFSQIRLYQINELYQWGIENTNLTKTSINDVINFFFSDRESTSLVNVSQIFHELVNQATKTFKIGNYVASEYAITVLLRRTKGLDIVRIYQEMSHEGILIRPPLSHSAKIKIIQQIISQMNKEELDILETTVIERLTKNEGLSESDAKNCIEKALQLGAITKTKSGNLSL